MVDFDQVAQDLTDGLISLGTRPRATAALRTLQGSIAEGLRSQVRDGVIRLVDSDQFNVLWREALRVAHTQLIATLRNDPAAIARINAEVRRVLAQADVRERLEREGAELIPGEPERLGALIASDLANWKKLITEARLTFE